MPEPLETLLARVKGALAEAPLPALDDAEPSPAIVLAGEALHARFAAELAGAGGELETMKRSEAPARAVALAKKLGARSFARWSDAALDPLAKALAAAGAQAIEAPEAQSARARYAELGIGLTLADAGIAETGTLLLRHGPGRPRLASAMARWHLALLARSTLVASLTDVPRLIAAGGGLPSNAVLVTGPSRTADIEGVQVMGMHGALKLFVFLVDD